MMNESKFINTRTQDLEPFYHDAGQFYWIKSSALLEFKKIFTSNTGFIELNEFEAQDVDNIEDWEMLTFKYDFINKKKKLE